MTKLPLFVIALALVGCKDKEKAKPATTTAPVPAPKLDVVAIDGTGPRVMSNRITGLVLIGADGSAQVATALVAPATPAVGGIPGIPQTLGLPPVTRRASSAFGAQAGSAEAANPIDALFAQLGHPEPASGAPAPPPARATSAFAIAHPHDVSAGVLVAAHPDAAATALVDVLALTGGFIAVTRGSELGALPYAFDRQPPPLVAPQTRWTEVRLGAGMSVETVPGKPIGVPATGKLGETVSATKATAVDLLVAPETKVSDVVDAIEQLRAAKVEAIGLGRIPAGDAMAARGEKGPRVLAWDFFLQDAAKGDAAGARTAFDAALAPMLGCYEQTLDAADSALLTGTARVELIVQPDGKVKELQALGVPRPLATCATAALKPVVFPKTAAAAKIVAQVAFVPR